MKQDFVILSEVIEEAMQDHDIPQKHMEAFQVHMGIDVYDWLNDNAKSFWEKLEQENED